MNFGAKISNLIFYKVQKLTVEIPSIQRMFNKFRGLLLVVGIHSSGNSRREFRRGQRNKLDNYADNIILVDFWM